MTRQWIRVVGPIAAALFVETVNMLREVTNKGLWDTLGYAYDKVISGYLVFVFPVTIAVVGGIGIVCELVVVAASIRRNSPSAASLYVGGYMLLGLSLMLAFGVIQSPSDAIRLVIFALFGVLHWLAQLSASMTSKMFSKSPA